MTAGVAHTAGALGRSQDYVARLRDFVARRAFSPRSRSPSARVGAEIEFIAIRENTGRVAPLEAHDGRSLLAAVRASAGQRGWREGRSAKGAPWFRLPTGGRITFEPGGQVEYASRPHASATKLLDDLAATAVTLREACAAFGIRLLDCGLDPVNGPGDAPLQVDAPRYRRMNTYFERIGPAGARMMRQTASLQLALDLGPDVASRWRLLNALAPVTTAVFANSRCYHGVDTGFASYRAETWRRTDPLRTGLFGGTDPVEEYLEFALCAPAMLLGADDALPRPFETWLDKIPDVAQWAEHLGTLFPDVRPRGYFEVRSIDAVPEAHWPAAIALVTGLAYDRRAARAAAEIARCPDAERLERAGRWGLSDAQLRRDTRDLARLAVEGCQRLGEAFISERHLQAAADFFGALTP
ncbi:MAG: glutamate-cysteine ligase family protein [Gemmatimonadaceae bacterium]